MAFSMQEEFKMYSYNLVKNINYFDVQIIKDAQIILSHCGFDLEIVAKLWAEDYIQRLNH